jgi:hypothetical protein
LAFAFVGWRRVGIATGQDQVRQSSAATDGKRGRLRLGAHPTAPSGVLRIRPLNRLHVRAACRGWAALQSESSGAIRPHFFADAARRGHLHR